MMAEDPEDLAILSDEATDEDQLGFGPYAQTLADIIADRQTDTPLTIGVFGGWGTGKTSLMRMVRRRLEATEQSPFAVRSTWFNAWLYAREPVLWRALVSRVLDAVRTFPNLDCDVREDLRQLEARLYAPTASSGGRLTFVPGAPHGIGRLSLPARAGLAFLQRQAERLDDADDVGKLQELIADVEESEALTRRDQIAALDEFRRAFGDISQRCIQPHGRLAVFIDDLDRCLPDRAVEVLEAVKLFLDVKGCVFVLGVERDVVEEGIRVRYKEYDRTKFKGGLYLEKIIQLPFSLPLIQPSVIEDYVGKVTGGRLPDRRCEKVFSVGLGPNPRRIKRTFNVFLLLWRLAQNREELQEVIKPVRLAKIVIIQQYHRQLFELAASGPHYLIDLERRFRERERADAAGERGGLEAPEEGEAAGVEAISAGPLSDFLGRGLLRALLTCTPVEDAGVNFIDLTPGQVIEYIYLARSAVEEMGPRDEAARLPFEPQMVTIPAGPFLMGTPEGELDELAKLGRDRDRIRDEVDQHEVALTAFAISRYPVTNAEYRRFIEDGGYANRDYWTEAGWLQKEGSGWPQPRYWEDDQWNDPSQPVVGVSWYEAAAYCAWLSANTARQYRLPSEAEWEKAARGTDGRRYPWGNPWDPSRCNNSESGPGRTTPVGQYPEGDSPYGVGDMVGQVWEWCRSKYAPYPYDPSDGREDPEGDELRVLRGGSWGDRSAAAACRCGFRYWNNPYNRYAYRGFRCVRTSS